MEKCGSQLRTYKPVSTAIMKVVRERTARMLLTELLAVVIFWFQTRFCFFLELDCFQSRFLAGSLDGALAVSFSGVEGVLACDTASSKSHDSDMLSEIVDTDIFVSCS